jgi:predicted amidohydrolase YtcJ
VPDGFSGDQDVERIIMARKNHKADIVVQNALVWTVDENAPQAEAIAIRGNEIAAVGSSLEIEAWAGPEAKRYDLGGKLVLPGFNDSHTHFMLSTASMATSMDLLGVGNLSEIQEILRKHAKAFPELEWLIGHRWAPPHHEGRWPTRKDLDAVEANRPVAIYDMDHHTAWVNTAMLETLGYDQNTPDPEGGTILREGDGFPNGILFEKAFEPIEGKALLEFEEFSTSIKEGISELHKIGLTSISDNANLPPYIDFCERMFEEGSLKIRVNHWPDLNEGVDKAIEIRERFQGNDILSVVGIKLFIDGALSNRTAWLLEEYADSPGEMGYPVNDMEELTAWVIEADQEGFQVITHAIGDRGVREMLDVYERAGKENGKRDSRHRIEHAELVHPEDQVRFGSLGVIPSMTPMHCATSTPDMYIPARIGVDRESYAYAWRDLIDSGARLCFGTDHPTLSIEQPEPLKQLFQAVTRIPPDDPSIRPWHPEQGVTIEEAIRCYTLEPAYAEFKEDRKGTITPGKLADLCVLDKNILEIDPLELLETQVVMTVFDGEVVHEAL